VPESAYFVPAPPPSANSTNHTVPYGLALECYLNAPPGLWTMIFATTQLPNAYQPNKGSYPLRQGGAQRRL